MKKIQILSLTCLAVLGALSVAELHYDRAVPTAPKPKGVVQPPENMPVSADEVVAAYLTGLTQGPEVDRTVAVASLMDRLESAEFAKAPISREASDAFVSAAELVLAQAQPEPDGSQLGTRIAGFIAGRTKGEKALSFVLKTLEQGPAERREAVALRVGSPTGVGGKAVYAKLTELAERGVISYERLPSALRRTGGARAADAIVALMRSTDNVKVISACVVALQDLRDPALLSPALERLEQVGAIDQPGKLPWIASGLLLEHMAAAEGVELMRGVKVLRARPALARKGAAAFERALEKGDVQTKQLAVEAVRAALVAGVLSSEQGEKLLTGRANPQAEPVLKASLPSASEVKAQ